MLKEPVKGVDIIPVVNMTRMIVKMYVENITTKMQSASIAEKKVRKRTLEC